MAPGESSHGRTDERRCGDERRQGERRHGWRLDRTQAIVSLLNDLDALLDDLAEDETQTPSHIWQERLEDIVRAYRGA